MKNNAVLLIHCPDQSGLVAEVTRFLHERGGNIIRLDEHVDQHIGRFFMRVEWQLDDFEIEEKEKIKKIFYDRIGHKYDMEYEVHFMDYKPRMAVFATKASHCLYEIIYRTQSPSENWNVDIPLVISNRESLRDNVEPFGIPYHFIKVEKGKKEEAEKKQIELLKKHDIDFIVFARYMQIVSDDFIARYPNRIINIHHSFLPAFIGPKPYHSAYERGVKIIGATGHYVTNELDAGPIIFQDVHRISHKDSVKDLIRKGRQVEKIVISEAIRLHLDRKILVCNNKTVIFD